MVDQIEGGPVRCRGHGDDLLPGTEDSALCFLERPRHHPCVKMHGYLARPIGHPGLTASLFPSYHSPNDVDSLSAVSPSVLQRTGSLLSLTPAGARVSPTRLSSKGGSSWLLRSDEPALGHDAYFGPLYTGYEGETTWELSPCEDTYVRGSPLAGEELLVLVGSAFFGLVVGRLLDHELVILCKLVF